jgi:hypothetical protein
MEIVGRMPMKKVIVALGVAAIFTTVAVSSALGFGCAADNGVQVGWAASEKDTPAERKWAREKAVEQCEARRKVSPHPGHPCPIRGCSADVKTEAEAKAKWPM